MWYYSLFLDDHNYTWKHFTCNIPFITYMCSWHSLNQDWQHGLRARTSESPPDSIIDDAVCDVTSQTRANKECVTYGDIKWGGGGGHCVDH